MTKVLMVVSAADRWTLNDGTEHPSGYWGEELAVPHRIFTEAGWEVAVATPGGIAPTLDRLSLAVTASSARKRHEVVAYLDAITGVLEHPLALDQADADDYDVVFYPGGHGPMEDLAYDETSGRLLARVLYSGKPLALLCHAPAAALAAKNPDGSWPFAGFRMTGLSNREERFNRFARKAKWLVEDRLREMGADYTKGRMPLRPYVVVDRNLYTGQNPASSEELARRLVAELGAPALHAEASRVVRAPRQELYDYISAMTNMGQISPENRETRWITPGRRFIGRNRIGVFYHWSMTGTVEENVPGEAFGFLTDSPSETHWRYTFQDAPGGTLVTESMRKARPQIKPVVFMQDISGARNRQEHLTRAVQATLGHLATRFENR